MSDKPKYLIIGASDSVELQERVNQVSDDYSLRETFFGNGWYYASMGLRVEGKYDDIEKYRLFPITQQEQTLPDGWQIIHHTSKELVGVTKNTIKLSVVRECLTSIFQIAEDNDVLDTTIMDQIYKYAEMALDEFDGRTTDTEEDTEMDEQTGVGY